MYGKETERTLENMSFSNVRLSAFPDFVKACALVKKAAAISNYRAGELEHRHMQLITAACDEIIKGLHHDEFPVDVYHGGGGIGINMNINEVISRLSGDEVDTVEHVNMSQSTSEVNHTAMRIAMIHLTRNLIQEIDRFNIILSEKSEEFRDVQTIARTCWRDGLSVSVSVLFEALHDALKRNRNRLELLVEELHFINLGWTVIGSGDGASEGYRSYILEALHDVTQLHLSWPENLYAAAQYPDDIARLSADIRICASLLMKFANDLRILSSGPEAGLGELIIPEVQAGSSFFPGKVNPVIPEMVIQCAILINGNNHSVQDALNMGETYLNLWEEMMGFLVMDNLYMLTKVIRSFGTLCVRGIKVDVERCLQYSRSSSPMLMKAKQEFGYRMISDWIHQDGVSGLQNRMDTERGIRKHERGET